MGITGLCWSFEGYRDGLSAVMGTRVFGNRGGGPEVDLERLDNGKSINLEEAITLANKELNYEGELTVSLPNEKIRSIVSVRLRTILGQPWLRTDYRSMNRAK